ncbi:MAG: membrane protein insertion efficiency factor YidD [Crenarchaeota archaeon]|nr:membrane protein insertion efficiency factor YidD [Thermoproteota archaeon]
MFRKLVIYIIKIYQKWISPLKIVPSCRFYPTCSQYAVDAVSKYGVLKGGFMALRRLLKCNPFHPGGYDPVK